MALTSEGLEVRRYPEVLADLVTSAQTLVDPDIDVRDDTVIGQYQKVLALQLTNVESYVEAAYDNADITLAEGKYLDKKAYEKGLQRQPQAKSSTSYQSFVGLEGTVIPVGTVLESTVGGDLFNVTQALTLTSDDCQEVVFSVSTVLDNTSYTVTVNNVNYNYTSDATATALEIVTGLKALIDADGSATWAANLLGETLEIATLTVNNISVSSTTYLTVDSITSHGRLEAQQYGPIVAVVGTLTTLVSSVSGLSSTTNTQDVVIGRFTEDDETFRTRIINSNSIASVATHSAITSRLAAVIGVTNVKVINNNTNAVDGEGRPPKSFECIVDGGTDEDVAEEIWATQSLSIETHGTTSVIITDADDQQQTIKLTRPSAINLAFQVTYSAYDEETLPASADEDIKEVVEAYTSALGLGVDIIPSRYFGPIYSAVSGIDSLVVEVQGITNPGDTPSGGSWQTTKLDIASSSYGSTTTPDVYPVPI